MRWRRMALLLYRLANLFPVGGGMTRRMAREGDASWRRHCTLQHLRQKIFRYVRTIFSSQNGGPEGGWAFEGFGITVPGALL